MNRAKGYTLIEVMIVVMIVGIFLVVVAGIASSVLGVNGNHEEAVKAAEEFAKNVPGVVKTECVQFDSDNDGYISCTLFREKADPMFIECAKKWTLNKGCRAPKMTVRR